MKFRPILFSTPMVKAVLDGSKTQTRRIIKPQPDFDSAWKNWGKTENPPPIKYSEYWLGVSNGGGTAFCVPNVRVKAHVGDIFWVRETWALDYFGRSQYWHFKEGIDVDESDIVYKASSDDLTVTLDKKWKPSIFMPKQACRIFLKCTNVRVERLHDISEEDAIAEGVHPNCHYNNNPERCGHFSCLNVCATKGEWFDYTDLSGECFPTNSAKESFLSLWKSINGKESLEKNPWVWVYDFEKVEQPLNFK